MREMWKVAICIALTAGSVISTTTLEARDDNNLLLKQVTEAEVRKDDLGRRVSDLLSEVRSLAGDLRNARSELAKLTESGVSARQAENDHVSLHWLQTQVAEIRAEMAEMAAAAEARKREAERTAKAKYAVVRVLQMELKEMRADVTAMRVKLLRDEAAAAAAAGKVGNKFCTHRLPLPLSCLHAWPINRRTLAWRKKPNKADCDDFLSSPSD